MCKIIFANKSSCDTCQLHASQLHISDAIPDNFATGNDKLNNDLSTMVTPPRSSLEYSAVNFTITTGDIETNQLIPTITAQGNEIMQTSNGHQLITSKFKIMRSCNFPVKLTCKNLLLQFHF